MAQARITTLVSGGRLIRRKYHTHSWKGTLMVINTVGHLAEAAWHHPDITASYAWVEVRLKNHAAKGITDKDFELAKKIEEMIQWQPGKAGERSTERQERPTLRTTSNTTLERCEPPIQLRRGRCL